ncbi:MAG: hypothetical protein FWE53_01960 [Firmicutes bacterium]|nr:hypothetical protein [Bacillota bacterium]
MTLPLPKSFLIGALLFGSVVGAGFASGKEILFYFARFGYISLIFVVLAVALFTYLGYVFLSLGRKFGLTTVKETSSVLFGKYAGLAEFIMLFGNLVLLSSMLAGSNSLFAIILPWLPIPLAGIITALCCFLIVLKGFKWLVRINEFIAPVMTVIIVALFFVALSLPHGAAPAPESGVFMSLVFAILFVTGNMFFVGFIIAKYGKDCTKKQAICGSAIAGGLLLICIAAEILTILLTAGGTASDMPLVLAASTTGAWFQAITLSAIWLSILTTACIMHYTVVNYFGGYIKNKALCALLVIIAAFLLSLFGFSNIVSYLYPILAGFGAVFCIAAVARNRN